MGAGGHLSGQRHDLLVIPFAPGLFGQDLNLGLLYFFAIGGLSVVGLLMAGWSSYNKYSLLGGLRAAAQVISYEIPLTLSVVGLILLAGTISPHTIVEQQAGWFTDWYVFRQPLAVLIFFIAATAEANRTPFDLTEADSEIVAGFATEYSGMRFGFFFFAEYVNVFIISALTVTLFFGGWNAPFPWPWPVELSLNPGDLGIGLLLLVAIVPLVLTLAFAAPISIASSRIKGWQALIGGFVLANLFIVAVVGAWAYIGLDWVAGLLWFLIKTYGFVFTFVWMRGTLPRVRIDQLMDFAWKWLPGVALEPLRDGRRHRGLQEPAGWPMSFVPGLGIAKGMALTLRRFFEPKVTIKYPEERHEIAPKVRGRLQLLYDEWGTSSARPASSAPRPARSNASTWAGSTRAAVSTSTGARRRPMTSDARSRRCGAPAGRSPTRPTARSRPSTSTRSTPSSTSTTTTRRTCSRSQSAYGYLPVAALKRISQLTGAWYAMIYGTASYYSHLRFEPAEATAQAAAVDDHRPPEASYLTALDAALGGAQGAPARRRGRNGMVDLLKTPTAWPTILLERAGASDPTDLDAATRAGAFVGLRRVIRDLGSTATIATIAASGLRGRGGAGFPAAVSGGPRQRPMHRAASSS